MSRRRRLALVAMASVLAASLTHFTDASGSAAALIFLASGVVIGEMLVLRLENGTAVPLSYAVLLVLASSFRAPQYAAVVVGAEVISAVLRASARSVGWRIRIVGERVVVAAGTIAVYDLFRAATHHDETV